MIIAVCAAGLLLFALGKSWVSMKNPIPEKSTKTYESQIFGLKFSYPAYYFLEEKNIEAGHTAIILTEDTEENRAVREGEMPGREGPTAITFDIYENPSQLSPLEWVEESRASNFHISKGEYEEIYVAGKPSISYSFDGLYQADSVVLSHRGNILMLTAMYLEPSDQIRKDFYEIIKTLSFY